MKTVSLTTIMYWAFAILCGLVFAMLMQRLNIFPRPFTMTADAEEVRTTFFALPSLLPISAVLVFVGLSFYARRNRDELLKVILSFTAALGLGIALLWLLQDLFLRSYYGYYDNNLYWFDPGVYIFIIITSALVCFFAVLNERGCR